MKKRLLKTADLALNKKKKKKKKEKKEIEPYNDAGKANFLLTEPRVNYDIATIERALNNSF